MLVPATGAVADLERPARFTSSHEVQVRDRDPKDMVRDVLEPGEELLWYGAPNVEAGAEGRARGSSVPFFVMFAAVVGLFVFQSREPGVPLVETLRFLVVENPAFLFGIAAVFGFFVVMRLVGMDPRSRLRRHFSKHAYGLTDRRVIVIEGKTVTTFAGDELDQPRVVERANGYDDVIFGTRRTGTSNGRTTDPIQRERRTIGFKAVPNAGEMKARLDGWIVGEIRESAEAVTDFIEAQADGASVGFAASAATATVRHPDSGMIVEYPEEWSLKVRKKKKPFGKTFLDMEKWKEPGELHDWTALRLEGPMGCAVDAEVFETPQLADYDSMANSRLASLAGELIDGDPMYEQNGLRGFTVARRTPVQANASTGTSGPASVVTPFRHTVLHDGRYQITVTSKWPEASPELAQAVDLVVRSVRLA